MSRKLWNTKGFHKTIPTHVIIDSVIATADDFATLADQHEQSQRQGYEPWTLDFEPEDAPEIYAKAQSIVEQANQTFGFHLVRWQQPLRFNRYGVGLEFKMHCDYTNTDNSKLAFVHMIEEPYEGGELLIVSSPSVMKLSLKAGQTIVFPAYLMHQVQPIISGTRLVLVGWATGNQFV